MLVVFSSEVNCHEIASPVTGPLAAIACAWVVVECGSHEGVSCLSQVLGVHHAGPRLRGREREREREGRREGREGEAYCVIPL